MARKRVRAVIRKAEQRSAESVARRIADGVYVLAVALHGSKLPLPVQLQTPIQYAAELLASATIERDKLPADWVDDLTLYYLAGLQERAVHFLAEFDREHFLAWITEERRRLSSPSETATL